MGDEEGGRDEEMVEAVKGRGGESGNEPAWGEREGGGEGGRGGEGVRERGMRGRG